VYDPGTNRMIVFGGIPADCSSPLNDTWVLTNANGLGGTPTWIQLTPGGTLPSARSLNAAAYDAANDRMIIFGGDGASCSIPAMYNDVWVLTGASGTRGTPTWGRLTTAGTAPPGLAASTAAYDAVRNRLIVFGGNRAEAFCGQTTNGVWILSNANGLGGTPTWTQISSTGPGPSARWDHVATYDPGTDRMTIFGGDDACRNVYNDTSVLTGVSTSPTWTQIAPAGTPPNVSGTNINAAYDPALNRMTAVLANLGQTFVLSDANGVGTPTWSQLNTTAAPPARLRTSLTYDPSSGNMTMFGGAGASSLLNDVWVLAVPKSGCSYAVSTALFGVSVYDAEGRYEPEQVGTIEVAAPAGCAWTAESTSTWITVTTGSSGTGNGTVTFVVARNEGVAPRRGGITIAGQAQTVLQAATSCASLLSETETAIGAAGGVHSLVVVDGPSCTWFATGGTSWLRPGYPFRNYGVSTDVFGLDVSPNQENAPRTGTLTIAGQTYTVRQMKENSGSCSPRIESASPSGFTMVGAAGTQGRSDPPQIYVGANSGCTWTAASNSPWISVLSGSRGDGNGAVRFEVEANTGAAPRRGTLTIAGASQTVVQAGTSCSSTLVENSAAFAGAGGHGRVWLVFGSGCAISNVKADVPWITLTLSNAIYANYVDYTVAPNTSGASRTGRITIEGNTYVVTQETLQCTYTLTAASATFSAAGGSGSVTLSASSGCPWTATANANWITIQGASAGTGSGTVTYNVGANSSPASRTGAMSIAGQNFTVTQSGVPLPPVRITSVSPLTAAPGAELEVSATGWPQDAAIVFDAGNGRTATSTPAAVSGTLRVVVPPISVDEQGTWYQGPVRLCADVSGARTCYDQPVTIAEAVAPAGPPGQTTLTFLRNMEVPEETLTQLDSMIQQAAGGNPPVLEYVGLDGAIKTGQFSLAALRKIESLMSANLAATVPSANLAAAVPRRAVARMAEACSPYTGEGEMEDAKATVERWERGEWVITGLVFLGVLSASGNILVAGESAEDVLATIEFIHQSSSLVMLGRMYLVQSKPVRLKSLLVEPSRLDLIFPTDTSKPFQITGTFVPTLANLTVDGLTTWAGNVLRLAGLESHLGEVAFGAFVKYFITPGLGGLANAAVQVPGERQVVLGGSSIVHEEDAGELLVTLGCANAPEIRTAVTAAGPHYGGISVLFRPNSEKLLLLDSLMPPFTTMVVSVTSLSATLRADKPTFLENQPAIVMGDNFSPNGKVEIVLTTPQGSTVRDSINADGVGHLLYNFGTLNPTGRYSVTATQGSVSAQTQFSVTSLESITLNGRNPATVEGGQTVDGLITLTGEVGDGGVDVSLTSSQADRAVPPKSVKVSSGKTATFKLPTTPGSGITSVNIDATLGSTSKHATLFLSEATSTFTAGPITWTRTATIPNTSCQATVSVQAQLITAAVSGSGTAASPFAGTAYISGRIRVTTSGPASDYCSTWNADLPLTQQNTATAVTGSAGRVQWSKKIPTDDACGVQWAFVEGVIAGNTLTGKLTLTELMGGEGRSMFTSPAIVSNVTLPLTR
jgi:hypothetical protein